MAKSDEDRLALSREAEAVWTNPLVRDYFENGVKAIFIEWSNSATAQEREDLYFEAMAMERFKNRLLRFISDGKATLRRQEDKGVADTIGPII